MKEELLDYKQEIKIKNGPSACLVLVLSFAAIFLAFIILIFWVSRRYSNYIF